MPEFARVPQMFVSIFHPASPQATHLLWLWNVCMIVCGFILAVVTAAIVYILIRYRRRDDREPSRRKVTPRSRSSGRRCPFCWCPFCLWRAS